MAAVTVGNPARDRAHLTREDPTCVYVVANGSLGMGAGKLAAQTFQAAMWMQHSSDVPADVAGRVREWLTEGGRTVVRVAETSTVWQRVLAEAEGLVLKDEGLTEVAHGAATVFCTWPVRRSQAPRVLSHRRVPLLGA